MIAGAAGGAAFLIVCVLGASAGAGQSSGRLNPVAAKALKVLQTHCARCHQHDPADGATRASELALGVVGNFLDLDAIAGEARLVIPGLPDGSGLYRAMVTRRMPPAGVVSSTDRGGTQGGVATEDIQAVRQWISQLPVGDDGAGVVGGGNDRRNIHLASSRDGELGGRLSLWLDKLRYRAGDEIVVYARPDQDCRLTLINVDSSGVATVLFPSDFARDNLVEGGVGVRVPSRTAGYRLKLMKAGVETIVGICTPETVTSLPGVEHDFDRLRFTVLGNWRNHISDALRIEADARLRGIMPTVSRRGRSRWRSKRKPSWLRDDGLPFTQVREAISVTVEK